MLTSGPGYPYNVGYTYIVDNPNNNYYRYPYYWGRYTGYPTEGLTYGLETPTSASGSLSVANQGEIIDNTNIHLTVFEIDVRGLESEEIDVAYYVERGMVNLFPGNTIRTGTKQFFGDITKLSDNHIVLSDQNQNVLLLVPNSVYTISRSFLGYVDIIKESTVTYNAIFYRCDYIAPNVTYDFSDERMLILDEL